MLLVLRAGERHSVNSRELNMVTSRRYLIASSLARLIRKERGGNRVTEGHFPNQADRSSFVVVEGDKGSLVLLHSGPNGPIEERTEVPRAHAETYAAELPDARLEIVDDAAHWLPFERPQELAALVRDFATVVATAAA